MAKDAPSPEDAVPLPRRLKITMKILEEFGTTDGCPQCTHIRAFRETKAGIAHTEACGKRIVEEMKVTAAGAARVERQELRTTRALAERVEAADRAPPVLGPHPRDAGVGEQGGSKFDRIPDPGGVAGMSSNEYAQAAMDRWSRSRTPDAGAS